MALNYFTLLGLEPSFALDEADLRKRYLAAQRESHPDRLVGKPEKERAVAIQRSMDVNEAYEALKSPLLRAQHLLELQGILVNSEGRDTVKPNQALLMEMMELREQIGEAASEADAAKAVQDLKAAMTNVTDKLLASFADNAYEDAAQQTIRLRYLGKALEEAVGVQYRLKMVNGE